jgi:predicted secreted protein
MTWWQGAIVFILVWWVTLFAVLPLWVSPAEPDDPGHAAGAPQRPRLALKALITTLIAAVVWLAIFFVLRSPWLGLGGS